MFATAKMPKDQFLESFNAYLNAFLEEIGKKQDCLQSMSEVYSRWGKLTLIIATVQDLQDQYEDVTQRKLPGERLFNEAQLRIAKLIEILCEAYYWGATRTRDALRRLPRLQKIDSRNVTIIRNKLLEHPDGNDGRLLSSFGFWTNREDGPVIKPSRADVVDVAEWPSRGLYTNHRQLIRDFSLALDSAARSKAHAAEKR